MRLCAVAPIVVLFVLYYVCCLLHHLLWIIGNLRWGRPQALNSPKFVFLFSQVPNGKYQIYLLLGIINNRNEHGAFYYDWELNCYDLWKEANKHWNTRSVVFCVCQQQFPNQNTGLFAVRRYKSVNDYLHTHLETVYLFGQTNALIIYLMICVYDLMSQPEKQ